MAVVRKQYIQNLHTSKAGNFSGNTELFNSMRDGEIAVQEHQDDTAIYVKRYLSGSTPSDTFKLARFIPENIIIEMVEAAKGSASTVVRIDSADTNTVEHMEITSGVGDNGKTIYTVKLKDVASASEVDAIETAVGLTSAGTYQVSSASTYIDNTTSVMNAVETLDDKLAELSAATADAISDLDASVSGKDASNFVTVNVAEEDGKLCGITVTTSDIASDTELGTVETAVGLNADGTHIQSSGRYTSQANTVEGEIAALDAALSAVSDDVEELSAATLSAITNLDYTDTAVDGQFVTEVDETDGVISVSRGYVTSGYVTIVSATSSETNVKEEYKLVNGAGTQLGQTIKIYKDSSLYNAYLGHVDDTITSSSDPTVVSGSGDTALCFIYEKTDGTYELVAVNVEEFLAESEFKDGLQVVNHEVSVKKDPTSEGYLSVSSNGVKLSGITEAIEAAKAASTTKVVEGTDAAGVMTIVSGSGADSSTTYTINLSDVAKASAVGLDTDGSHITTSGHYTSAATTITGEIAALDAALSAVSGQVHDLSAATQDLIDSLDYSDSGAVNTQVVTSVTESDGVISVARGFVTSNQVTLGIVHGTNAETVQLKNGNNDVIGSAAFSAATGVAITNGVINGVVDDASEDFLTVGANGFKVTGITAAIEAAKSASTTVVSAATDAETAEHLTISESEEADGHKVYTISLSNVADENEVVKTVVVNNVTGVTSANTATVTIDSDDILLGTAITGSTTIPVTSSITQALQSMQDQLDNASLNAVEDVTISGISGVTKTTTEVPGTGTTINFDWTNAIIDGGTF